MVGKVTVSVEVSELEGSYAGGTFAGIGKIGAGGGEETGAGGGIISLGRAHAIFRPVKAVVDPIVAVLHAERI